MTSPLPGSVSFWRTLFVQEGRDAVMRSIDGLGVVSQEAARAAMQFAFEEKEEAIARHIDSRWRGYLPMSSLENNADWINREVLGFLRGDKPEFWLDLLLSNCGHAQKCPFAIVFQEVENTLRSGAEFPMGAVERFFSIAVSHGIRTEDKNDSDYPSALTGALAVLPLLHAQPQDIKDRWRGLLSQIESNDRRLLQFDGWEGALRNAIKEADLEALPAASRNYVLIPEKDRRVSPFALAIDVAEKKSSHPLVPCFEILAAAGISPIDKQCCGATPLFSLLSATELSEDMGRQALGFLFARGASLDVPQANSVFVPSTDITHPLHVAVYLDAPPLDLLKPQVSSWDPVDVMGMTPMLYAARELKVEVVNALLDLGADPLRCTLAGNTIIHELFEYAVMDFADISVDMKAVSLLAHRLKLAGVDPLVANDQSLDAFSDMCRVVCSSERSGKCVLLLEHLDKLGWCMPINEMLDALPQAAGIQKTKKFLLKKKAGLDAVVIDQQTPAAINPTKRRLGL